MLNVTLAQPSLPVVTVTTFVWLYGPAVDQTRAPVTLRPHVSAMWIRPVKDCVAFVTVPGLNVHLSIRRRCGSARSATATVAPAVHFVVGAGPLPPEDAGPTLSLRSVLTVVLPAALFAVTSARSVAFRSAERTP